MEDRLRLDTPLVKVVGDRTADKFASDLGLRTVGDLLHHYPRRYVEQGALTTLGDLEVGDHVTVMARIVSIHVGPTRNGKLLGRFVVTDGTGTLDLTFFGRVASWYGKQLREGGTHLFAGTVSVFNNRRQLTHPEVFVDPADEKTLQRAGTVLPIYPATKAVSSLALKRAVDLVLDPELGQGVDLDDDPLPLALRAEHGLMSLRTALETIHRPADSNDAGPARERLRWDESFVLQVVLARRRAALRGQAGVPRPGRRDGLLDAFDAALPFCLTEGQSEIGEQLDRELSADHPMHRLLQGEVGSGKTVVALRAMLRVIDSGGQAALLAPTEVLAQQHARSLRSLLGPLGRTLELDGDARGTTVSLLTGSLGAAARRTALREAATGEAGIVVGTHALMSEGVEFADLGLVVIDEQHRFGVEQREALRAKGTAPHVLVLTATPIPRTVAMTVYGDLEVSVLRELPAGRSPISTSVHSYARLHQALAHVQEQVALGHQAFLVCPRIGDEPAAALKEGETRPPWAVLEVLEKLELTALAGVRVAGLHGRMAAEDKERVMRQFAGGELDVLVSTTVVEVGVDVPNATVMLVLDAERFGISQLHQLRGRIGRGSAPGRCVLMTELPASSRPVLRLLAVAGTTDGFELSELDLQLRGEGDVLGAVQSGGRSSLHFLTLADTTVIEQTRTWAAEVVAQDPQLREHQALRVAVDAILDAEQAAYLDKT